MLTAKDWGRLIGCKVERQALGECGNKGQKWRGYNQLSVSLLNQIEKALDRGERVPLKPVLRTFDQMTTAERAYIHDRLDFHDYLDSIGVDQRGWIEKGWAVKEDN